MTTTTTTTTSRLHRMGLCAAATALLAVTAAIPAQAKEDPGEPTGSSTAVMQTATWQEPRNCPLRRVDTQFVRCDDLTGAGVPAPRWVPEL